MKAVIMAGGRGTRIASLGYDVPKPMIPISGKPVLEHEIRCLKEQGLTDIIITVSYLGDVIMKYFGDGSSLGVTIEYFVETTPLGNAGALFQLKDKLTEDFLLLNADSLFDVDFSRMIDFHKRSGALATLFAHPNSHPYDSGLLIVKDGKVTQWLTKTDERPQWYRNLVNAGLHIVSPKVLDKKIDSEKVDLDRDILKPLVSSGRLFAYCSPEYVRDMGTPERFERVSLDFQRGIVGQKNLRNKQKAIFLDRDGTINEYVGFLTSIEQMRLLPEAASGIRAINDSSFLAIIVTNQPVIARGEVSEKELDEIHAKMETLLGQEGAYIDAIYYCPHHPDRGFPGEVPKYKKECDCRKPKPGLLLAAARDFNIDLSQSWIIGDGSRDIEAGIRAGCKAILVGGADCTSGYTQRTRDLLSAVSFILSVSEGARKND